MSSSPSSTCPSCGRELVLEIDPAAPSEERADVLLADPPYRYGCPSPRCSFER